MNILFLGATGTVGRQVLPILAASHAITPAALGGGWIGALPVADVDICDPAAVESLIRAGGADGAPFDAVINAAIAPYKGLDLAHRETRLRYFNECIKINAVGAYHLLEATAEARIPRFVYISSLSAVLGSPQYPFIDASCQDRPHDIYSAAKIFGEHAGRYYAHRPTVEGFSMQVICLRLGQPYKLYNRWDEIWKTDAHFRRFPVHSHDIASAIECALKTQIRYGVYPIVSETDNLYIDPDLYAELGYKPEWKFTAEGLIGPKGQKERDFQESIANVAV